MKCQPGEVQAVIPITSDMQMIPQKAKSRKQRGTKEPLDESESEKTGLKLNIQKIKIVASGSHHFMTNSCRNNGNSDRLYFLGFQNHYGW